MGGFQRKLRRASLRKSGLLKGLKFEAKPDLIEQIPGGYRILHPRKGWRANSSKRVVAGARLRDLYEKIDKRMAGRRRGISGQNKAYRLASSLHAARLVATEHPGRYPNSVGRQQKRWLIRKGLMKADQPPAS